MDIIGFMALIKAMQGGSGGVSSVNSKTGAVVLGASDVGAEPAITEVTVSTAGAVTQALDAGKMYHFTGAVTSLTVTFNAAASGQLAQYHLDFTEPSTAFTPSFPSGVKLPSGQTWEADTIYEVDIANNKAVVASWAVSA